MNILNKEIRIITFEIFTAEYVFGRSYEKTIYNHSIRNENNTAALEYSNPRLNSPRHMQFWLRWLWLIAFYLLCLWGRLPTHSFWRMPEGGNYTPLFTLRTIGYLLPLYSNLYTPKLNLLEGLWWLPEARWWFLLNLRIWDYSFRRKLYWSTKLRNRW